MKRPLKTAAEFLKYGFMGTGLILLLNISGCTDISQGKIIGARPGDTLQIPVKNKDEELEQVLEGCLEFFKEEAGEDGDAGLDRIRSIVNRLGENGYPAIDSRNQVDLTRPEQVILFCEMVDAGESGEITILEVCGLSGIAKYDLQTKDGRVNVVRSYYKYEYGRMQKKDSVSYPAEYWNFTKEGYLMFSGTWFSEELYMLTLSEAEEHTAFRVLPLDEICRELNRKYLLPIGYGQNNMFLTDWSEAEFGELNFYDMYDIFYPMVNAACVPYIADENLGVGAVYRIPKEEFEAVLMSYFYIDSATLQSKTTYHSEDAAYEYKPRGFYEVEYPEYPYPEVVHVAEQGDGIIALTVNVVFPYAGNSKVFAHEVVVRPLEDGAVQYVSNRVLPSEDNCRETWHVPRLTEEEWKELYGKAVAGSNEAYRKNGEI